MDDKLRDSILDITLETLSNKALLSLAMEVFNDRGLALFDIFNDLSNEDFQKLLTEEFEKREIDYFPRDLDGLLKVLNKELMVIDLFKFKNDQALLETFRILMNERNIDYLKGLDGETLMKPISDEILQLELAERNLLTMPKDQDQYEQFILDELVNRPVEAKKLLSIYAKPYRPSEHKDRCLKVIAMSTTYANDPRPELLENILGQLA